MSYIIVTNETRGTVVGDRIQVADTSLSRMVGLLGKRGVGAGGGLWIKPSSGVHTFFMRFAIDVIGLDKEMRVIKVWKELVPFRLTSISMEMRSVIELPPGQIVASDVQVGDKLRVR